MAMVFRWSPLVLPLPVLLLLLLALSSHSVKLA